MPPTEAGWVAIRYTPTMNRAPLLEVKNLSIAFGQHAAVRDISFHINQGETLGLVGESGSGKSAASLAILRLLPHTARVEGAVGFDGENLLGLPEEAVRRRRGRDIAMIFQEPMTALNPVMPVAAQIAEAIGFILPRIAQGIEGRRFSRRCTRCSCRSRSGGERTIPTSFPAGSGRGY